MQLCREYVNDQEFGSTVFLCLCVLIDFSIRLWRISPDASTLLLDFSDSGTVSQITSTVYNLLSLWYSIVTAENNLRLVQKGAPDLLLKEHSIFTT
jgi:hypothetical protein